MKKEEPQVPSGQVPPEDQGAPGAAIAPDELAALAAGLASPPSPGAAEVSPAPAPDPETAAVVAAVLYPTFALLAPNWQVSESDCQRLGEAYGAVIDKYFPGGLGGFGPELAAVVVTVGFLAPRLKKPMKLPEGEPDGGAAP